MSKGGKGASQAQQPVNPIQLAAAQTQSNVSTAQTQAALNNINTYSPYGSSAYTPSVDPTTGQTTYSLAQSLAPWGQALMGAQGNLAQYLASAGPTVANFGANLQGLGSNFLTAGLNLVSPTISPTLDLSGVPSPVSLTPGSFTTNVTTGAGGQPIPQTQTSVSGAGQGIATSVAPAGPIQMNLSPEDFGSQIKQTQDAAYQAQTQYLDPQFNQQEESLRQRLADQGIEEGSDAYSRAMLDFNNQKQQAYQSAQEGAVAAGNQLQQQLFTQQLQSGQFANSSEAQQYVQNLQDAGFINEAQAQNFNQQIQAGSFTNQAAQQVFGQGLSLADLYNQAVLGAAGTTNQAAQLGLARTQAAQQAPLTALQAITGAGTGVYNSALGSMDAVAPWVNLAPTWPISIPTMGGTPTTVQPTQYGPLTQAATGANVAGYNMGQQNLSNLLGLTNVGSQVLTGQSLSGLFGSGGLLGSMFGGGGDTAGAGAGLGDILDAVFPAI